MKKHQSVLQIRLNAKNPHNYSVTQLTRSKGHFRSDIGENLHFLSNNLMEYNVSLSSEWFF